MRKFVKRGTGLVAAFSLIAASSTAVAASTPAPTQINPWAALSMMSSGPSAVAYCGAAAAAAAAQPASGCVLPTVDAPPPPPPSSVMAEPVPPPLPGAAAGVNMGFNPLYLLLGAAALGALAYFLLKNDNNNSNSPA